MKLTLGFISLSIALLSTSVSAQGFGACFDHGNSGAEPAGAARLYDIVPPSQDFPYPTLKAVLPNPLNAQNVFRLIIEDVRFSSYKCWDQNKNLTGFDIEMMTQAAYDVGYKHIEFVLRTWNTSEVNGVKYPSLLIDLNNGLGDAVSAGMSMTPEREGLVHMIGPIYKAGKKLMARNDNAKITASKLADLLKAPTAGYESFRGLSVVVQGSTIRSDFFHRLSDSVPGLVVFAQLNESGDGFLPIQDEDQHLVVWDTDAATVESFIDGHMSTDILGKRFDLVMLDTGSTNELLQEGKLGVDTQIVTGNLSADVQLGSVFGKGDGISFRADSELIQPFSLSLAKMICSHRIDHLVTKWFKDENSADHSWAVCQ